MTRKKETISKSNPKLIVLALGFIGFIIGITLGVNFVSILIITVSTFILKIDHCTKFSTAKHLHSENNFVLLES